MVGSSDFDVPYEPRPQPNYPPQTRPPHNNPQQYQAPLGDISRISCEIQNHDKQTSWRRQDGRPLPRNSYLSGGDLIINPVEHDAAGVYDCVVYESDGGEYPIVTAELVVIG